MVFKYTDRKENIFSMFTGDRERNGKPEVEKGKKLD